MKIGKSRLRRLIREAIEDLKQELGVDGVEEEDLDEMTTTGDVAGYDAPFGANLSSILDDEDEEDDD